jgi:hypothetical protein
MSEFKGVTVEAGKGRRFVQCTGEFDFQDEGKDIVGLLLLIR